jgi:hypothetical protein
VIMLPPIEDLTLVGVFDRGIANKERIVLRATKATEMAQYGIIVAWNPLGANTVSQPYNDFFFWFGDGVVQGGETIFVYTGKGEPRKTTVEGTSNVAYVVHWNRPTTLFADSRVVPLVITIGQLIVPGAPLNALQLSNLADIAKPS